MLFKQTFALPSALFALCTVLQLTAVSSSRTEDQRIEFPISQEMYDTGYDHEYLEMSGIKRWYIPEAGVYVTDMNFVHHGYDDNYYGETGVKRWWVSHDPETFTYQEPEKSVSLSVGLIQKMRDTREFSIDEFDYMDENHYEKTGKKVWYILDAGKYACEQEIVSAPGEYPIRVRFYEPEITGSV